MTKIRTRNGAKQSVRMACALLLAFAGSALAGPPYISDDPQPTDAGHYEIYFFASGAGRAGDGAVASAYGIDFNYGPVEDVQLTATLPIAHQSAQAGAGAASGLGNVELALKYRFLHQQETGWDVAFFPRLFLPAPDSRFGEKHASLLLPLWVEKDWGEGWSTFGGGGCEWNRGRGTRNFCLAGWALTRQVLPKLQLGVELAYQTADASDARASTSFGVGLKYDIDDHLHWLAYAGPGLQNLATNPGYDWYTSLLVTF